MSQRHTAVDLIPKVRRILQNGHTYHEEYYAAETFGGPSLHFHRRALGLNGEVSESLRLELIYAVLSSWGMHRMGKGGSKMKAFDTFANSVKFVHDDLEVLHVFSPASMTSESWSRLKRVFEGIEVMASGTSLVGNSKVMAHLLPNIVVPIDREYTLKYLFGSGDIQNDLNLEWLLMRKILEEFFYPVVNDRAFQRTAGVWISPDPVSVGY